MASEHRQHFFEGVKDHSQIKLRAFQRYLKPWATMVGSPRNVHRVWIVDGFAGPGTYRNGDKGSPVLALELADELVQSTTSYKIACILVEKSRANFRQLQRLPHQFRAIEVFAEIGSFWDRTETILSQVRDEPVLLFIDPFGLGDLDFERLVGFCTRLSKVDLMVNLASPAAARLAPNHSALIDRAVGGAGWNVETITETFCRRLESRAGFLRAVPLPVTAAMGELKYVLVLAAKHRSAYRLWNDEIATSERDILNGGDQAEIGTMIRDAMAAVRDAYSARRTSSREEIRNEFYVERCGEHHTRTINRAIDLLISSGDWTESDSGPKDRRAIRIRG